MANIFYTPFGMVLNFLYQIVRDYGVALFLFTLIFRLIILPTAVMQQKNAAKQFRLQPKLKKLQKKYSNDKKKLQEEQQALYSREGFNPLSSGCGPLLFSLPIIYGLYGAIYKPLSYVIRIDSQSIKALTKALGNVKNVRAVEIDIVDKIDVLAGKAHGVPSAVINQIQDFAHDFKVFGIIELTKTPNFKAFNILWLIPIFAGITSLLTSLYTFLKQRKTNETAANVSMGCMMFGMPIFSIFMTFTLPAGVGFYWICSNVISFIQTVALSKVYDPKKVSAKSMITDTIERCSKEANVKKASELK